MGKLLVAQLATFDVYPRRQQRSSNGETSMKHTRTDPSEGTDRLLTFREASDALQLPYFKIQRAAKNGLIPTYSLLNSRKYVKLRDIFDRMSAA
jgi:hypothetical protein